MKRKIRSIPRRKCPKERGVKNHHYT